MSNPFIVGLTVSVNYEDLLDTIAKNTLSVLDDFIVVTTQDDIETQKICKKYNITTIISDRCYENGAPFNKSKMINDGLKFIYETYPSAVYLLLDSDIYLGPDLKHYINDIDITNDMFLWCPRYMVPLNIKEIELSEIFDGNICNYYKEVHCGQGYFQLFKNKLFYDERYNTACASDTVFWRQFKDSILIDNYSVIHIGEIAKNWNGRITEKRIGGVE